MFYALGSIIYLEFIELNFCNLNFYTKRQIKKRSTKEDCLSLEDITEYDENDEEIK